MTQAPEVIPRRDWSLREVQATVDDYFEMYEAKLAGRPYSETEHHAALLPLLDGRSAYSLSLKYKNISAVLAEQGLPPLHGDTSQNHWQRMLRDVVIARLEARPQLLAGIGDIASAGMPAPSDFSLALVSAPPQSDPPLTPKRGGAPRRGPDYLELARENSALGQKGELWVVELEQWRLTALGLKHLADRVEHVAKTQGDGLGYDVLSFNDDESERHIEVKTTRYGIGTPFFVTAGELWHSEEVSGAFHLYRVFEWPAPQYYDLVGCLSDNLRLAPTVYRAVR